MEDGAVGELEMGWLRRVLEVLLLPFMFFVVLVVAVLGLLLILFGFERCRICKRRVGPFQRFVIYDDFVDMGVVHRSCYLWFWGDDEVG